MKVWMIVATSLIVAGILVFIVAIAAANFDFVHMMGGKLDTKSYDITEKFDSLSIDVDISDVSFVAASDGKCKVVCNETAKEKHLVEVKDGALKISVDNNKKWYEHISFFTPETTVTVFLPETSYKSFKLSTHTGDVWLPNEFNFESIEIKASTADVKCGASSAGLLKIETTTGDIKVEGLSANELGLSVSTGEIEAKSINCLGNAWIHVSTGEAEIEQLTCKNLETDGDTGDFELSDVLVSENLSITRSTGDVSLENCDAGEITIKTDTGDVKGTLRTPKIFIASSSTGKVDVPETTTGGKCKVTTSTGSIKFYVKQ